MSLELARQNLAFLQANVSKKAMREAVYPGESKYPGELTDRTMMNCSIALRMKKGGLPHKRIGAAIGIVVGGVSQFLNKAEWKVRSHRTFMKRLKDFRS